MKNINYRDEDWIINIEKNNNGHYAITATNELYLISEKIITDTLEDKDIIIKKLIDKILDDSFIFFLKRFARL